MTIVVSTTSISSVALYNSLVSDIYNLTQRPDLIQETATAIRKATMKCHLADFWKNDLVEISYTVPVLTVPAVSYRYALDLTDVTIFPLYRKISHIKEYNNPLTGQEIQFKELDADRLLDNYKLEDINCYYQAGQQVQLRANKFLTTLNIGYYKYPNVVPATYNSWIAVQYPDAVIDEAVAQIYRIIGKDQEAARLSALFGENIHYLTMTQV